MATLSQIENNCWLHVIRIFQTSVLLANWNFRVPYDQSKTEVHEVKMTQTRIKMPYKGTLVSFMGGK